MTLLIRWALIPSLKATRFSTYERDKTENPTHGTFNHDMSTIYNGYSKRAPDKTNQGAVFTPTKEVVVPTPRARVGRGDLWGGGGLARR